MAAGRHDEWLVVVPVKRLALAKSRLAAVGPTVRHSLALAMALDTVAVAAELDGVRVVVVTEDPQAAAGATELGALVVADVPAAGINSALVYGATTVAASLGIQSVAALAGDLPAIRAGDLSMALERAAPHHASYVPDAAGLGTTLYAAATVTEFKPAFGPASRTIHARHATELEVDGLDSLRQDVDTLDDLRAAQRLGLGPRTAAIAAPLLAPERFPPASPANPDSPANPASSTNHTRR